MIFQDQKIVPLEDSISFGRFLKIFFIKINTQPYKKYINYEMLTISPTPFSYQLILFLNVFLNIFFIQVNADTISNYGKHSQTVSIPYQ